MSDVKRYRLASGDDCDGGIIEDPAGDWVSFKDYVDVAATVEAIQLFTQMDGISPHTKIVAIRGVLGEPIWDRNSILKP